MSDLAINLPQRAGKVDRLLGRLARRVAVYRRALRIAGRRRRAAVAIDSIDPRLLRDAGFDLDSCRDDPRAVRDRHLNVSLMLPR